MGIWLCTREDVKAAPDIAERRRSDQQIDRIIAATTTAIEKRLVRHFAPQVSTRTKDWPLLHSTGPWWILYLDADELTAVTELVSGGVTLSPDQYLLRPDNAPDFGEPFTSIEVNLAGTGSFDAGPTWQRAISIAGTFGFSADNAATFPAVTALTADATDSGTVSVADGSQIGVGSLLGIGAERLVVTGRRQVDTGDTLAGDLGALGKDNAVQVGDVASWQAGETFTVDTETVLIEDILGSTLSVQRAWNGTTLAAHTAGTRLFSPRQLVCLRGQQGSAAASHSSGTTVSVWEQPDVLRQLCIAQSVVTLLQTRAGYPMPVRTGSGGSSSTPTAGRPLTRPSDLSDLWDQADTAYGRVGARIGVI